MEIQLYPNLQKAFQLENEVYFLDLFSPVRYLTLLEIGLVYP